MKPIKVISIFSGCGGLDLGLEGGFRIKRSFVQNKSWINSHDQDFVLLKKTAFKTIFACDIKPSAQIAWEGYFKRKNIFHLESIVDIVKKAHEGKIVFPDADIVTGGFPCQDFSIAGKRNGFASHKNHDNKLVKFDNPTIESRGMLYYWMREAIALIKPKIFIAENVKGLMSMGDVKQVITNDFRNINSGYTVLEPLVLNAANFGVPQNRERIIFIGVRNDSISAEAIRKLSNGDLSLYPEVNNAPNSTVKDAIFDLCEPENSLDPSHQKYSKAKWYGKHCQGQTEINPNGLSPTIRSEHHGNIEFRRLAQENGGKILDEYHLPQRRLSVRECARIQTFPDEYQFVSDKIGASEAYKLIGNAVPPLLGYHIARKLELVWQELFKYPNNIRKAA